MCSLIGLKGLLSQFIRPRNDELKNLQWSTEEDEKGQRCPVIVSRGGEKLYRQGEKRRRNFVSHQILTVNILAGRAAVPTCIRAGLLQGVLTLSGREASDRGPRARGEAAGGPVEGAVLAGGVGALLGGGRSPATFGPKQAALALGRPLRRPLRWTLRLALGLLRLGAGRTELGAGRTELGRQRR
ncbi:hypothetical protein EYF80_004989 [Liparis tanakae]|uniref:Uncharacterized protein n=1 Tax=Liparis tanakae TaxID=230148 RepID=A0A4Z2J4X3_9TELE|nr:hypothetical protein EYF80_004989 [Liparis tanakae]